MDEMDKGKTEARRWLSRQLAWETNLDRLVTAWEKEQGLRRHPAGAKARAPRSQRRKTGLPLENPAA